MTFLSDPKKDDRVQRKFDQLSTFVCSDCGSKKHQCAVCKTTICLDCYPDATSHACSGKVY